MIAKTRCADSKCIMTLTDIVMQMPNRPSEFQIAEDYAQNISGLIERDPEWWSEAQRWEQGNYGKTINLSLNAARELINSEIEYEPGVNVFTKFVGEVLAVTSGRIKKSKMASESVQVSGEMNQMINSIARKTLARLKDVGPRSEQPETESPAAKETGFDISKVQQILLELKYFSGPVDGIFGPKTAAAIRNFQEAKGLSTTGVIDKDTFDLIVNPVSPETPPEQKNKPGNTKTKTTPDQVKNLFLPLLASEGNHTNTKDRLEFESDYKSLATVISLDDVKPPLAIGLFGNWGSGKSFFMEKLSIEIQKIAKSKTAGFIEQVVQVKFNSWHYSDSNLWASLITEIFDSLSAFAKEENKTEELEKLSETLNITAAQREAVEACRNELQAKIERLLIDKERQRNRLEDISGIGIFRLLISDKNISDDLKSLKNENVESIIASKEKLEGCINELKNRKTEFRYFVQALAGMQGKRWLAVLLISLLILAGTITLKYLIPDLWQSVTYWISGIGLILTTIAGNIMRLLAPVKKEFRTAVERLTSIKATLEARPEIESDEVNRLKSEVALHTKTIESLDKRITESQKEINDLKTGRKLVEFIEQKSRDENYSKQLGLISWIRKDFCKLDELLRKQHLLTKEGKKEIVVNPYDVTLKIDRIILYIDDLDRCKEEIVVKVLEAIHLLLAFPLFVVVVGVDPRWLNNALSQKYKNLFGKHYSDGSEINLTTAEEISLSGVATSYDYLEKIFQIPFSLRQINAKGRKDLIEYLLHNEMEKEEPAPKSISNVGVVPSPDNVNITGVDVLKPGDKTKIPDEDSEQDILNEHREKLTFSKDELECMQNISAIFGHSPRTINRFINIYRIIKAHRKLIITEKFSEDDFAPIMLVLSVMIGYSDLAQDFINKLARTEDTVTFNEFINREHFPDHVKKKIIESINSGVAKLPLKVFKANLELISRFSFRTFAVSIDGSVDNQSAG